MTGDFECGLPEGFRAYERSIVEKDCSLYALVKGPGGSRSLYTTSSDSCFCGKKAGAGRLCPLTAANAFALKETLPWLAPRRLPEGSSFGFGDRVGLATPGHIRAVRGKKTFPVLAQQSVRENTRTGRSFEQVLADAVFGAFQEGYRDGYGADADHLKTVEDALEAAELGYTFFTCDPGDHVAAVEDLSDADVEAAFERLPEAGDWSREYLDQEFRIGRCGTLRFTRDGLRRTAVKYGAAVRHATSMYRALAERLPKGFDYEVSVDETETPTSSLEHLFIALELRRRGVRFVSLAPRFVGAMEKGVDWRGDLSLFVSELRAHAAIARALGSYRLSLHSGSDKFSLYEAFARETDETCHVKTAGTSYLVALEIVARRKPALFRKIVQLALEHFSRDSATYHLSADPSRIPLLERLSDSQLENLVAELDSRQVLHVTYGSVLGGSLGKEFRCVLETYEEDHYEGLACHMERHLALLGVEHIG